MARKKLNSDILSIRDFKEGVEGVVGEIQPMTREDGSAVEGSFGQALATVEFADVKTGEVRRFWVDGGLRGTFKMAKVKPGQKVAVVHTGEKMIDTMNSASEMIKGRVQTYDVFELT